MQTRIYRKKYVNGSLNSEGHLKNTSRDVYLGLDLSIYVTKSPIQLVRQPFKLVEPLKQESMPCLTTDNHIHEWETKLDKQKYAPTHKSDADT
jgi:hypothetical protein